MSEAADDEQLALRVGARRRSPSPRRRDARRRSVPEPAASLPVARVAVDVPLAHLDRPFDYLVPESLDEAVVPGGRVRVRFAGRLVDGFVLDRVAGTEHAGRLAFLAGAGSAEPVVSAEVLHLARDIADRYGGTLADVLRLAVPPRHGGGEAAAPASPGAAVAAPAPPDPAVFAGYERGPAFLAALAAGRAPRAVWAALPGPAWPAAVAAAVQATVAGGRGAVVVVADARDADRVDAALHTALGPDRHVRLTADVGPRERYRRYLAARRGAVSVVVGSRAAAFAPVPDLGLVVIWDDGDDLYAEPRAPYPHARDVLVRRAHLAGAGALIGGYAVTAEGAALVASGWAHPLRASRAAVRAAAPAVEPTGDDADLARDPAARSARLPTAAWQAARRALAADAPVLVQVPRRGYQPWLACARCRTPARCAHCSGPLAGPAPDGSGAGAGGGGSAGDGGRPVGGGSPGGGGPVGGGSPVCRWCARPATDWQCPVCDSPRLRAVVVGARRTAEELGRAFPGVPVRLSGGDAVLAGVPAGPAIVVATPGAEPVAPGGYGAVLLLDAWLMLQRADLRAAEETLRRWFGAAALARPGADGGRVVVVADGAVPAVQALLRWDPFGHAERELADRTELGFPPATRLAAVTGTPAAVAGLLAAAELPASVERLGPVPVPVPGHAPGAGAGIADTGAVERLLLRVPRADGAALAAALKAAQAVRSAHKDAEPVRVQLDPLDVL